MTILVICIWISGYEMPFMRINESRRDGCVGFWWYTDNKQIIGTISTLENAELDGIYYQYSRDKNHMSVWREVVEKQVPNHEEKAVLLRNGYRSIERGRVVYDTRSGSYTVFCSKMLVNDKAFQTKVKNFYNLNHDMVDFEVLNHYYVCKPTGNPTIDNFEPNY